MAQNNDAAQNQDEIKQSNQSPARRQGEQRRNINVAKMLNTVRETAAQVEQFRNISPTNQPQVEYPNLNQSVSSSSVVRQVEKPNSNIACGNCPPSGPPTPSGSLAGGGCNRRCKQQVIACPNLKLPSRVRMTTNKSNKKSAFTLTDEQKALVLDNYYPGLIHDAVNQKADFNEIAKKYVTPETAVDGDKAEKGMSLIEAFDTRVKYEQINLTKLLGKIPEKESKTNKAKKDAKPYLPVYGPLPHPVVSDIALEDDVRASAIPIDLQHYVRGTPENDPVRAIACLTRAQQLNDYYKEYKAAQAAANLAPPSKIEEAASQGVSSFKIDSLSAKTETVDTGYYKSLELVSYLGVTKPD